MIDVARFMAPWTAPDYTSGMTLLSRGIEAGTAARQADEQEYGNLLEESRRMDELERSALERESLARDEFSMRRSQTGMTKASELFAQAMDRMTLPAEREALLAEANYWKQWAEGKDAPAAAPSKADGMGKWDKARVTGSFAPEAPAPGLPEWYTDAEATTVPPTTDAEWAKLTSEAPPGVDMTGVPPDAGIREIAAIEAEPPVEDPQMPDGPAPTGLTTPPQRRGERLNQYLARTVAAPDPASPVSLLPDEPPVDLDAYLAENYGMPEQPADMPPGVAPPGVEPTMTDTPFGALDLSRMDLARKQEMMAVGNAFTRYLMNHPSDSQYAGPLSAAWEHLVTENGIPRGMKPIDALRELLALIREEKAQNVALERTKIGAAASARRGAGGGVDDKKRLLFMRAVKEAYTANDGKKVTEGVTRLDDADRMLNDELAKGNGIMLASVAAQTLKQAFGGQISNDERNFVFGKGLLATLDGFLNRENDESALADVQVVQLKKLIASAQEGMARKRKRLVDQMRRAPGALHVIPSDMSDEDVLSYAESVSPGLAADAGGDDGGDDVGGVTEDDFK